MTPTQEMGGPENATLVAALSEGGAATPLAPSILGTAKWASSGVDLHPDGLILLDVILANGLILSGSLAISMASALRRLATMPASANDLTASEPLLMPAETTRAEAMLSDVRRRQSVAEAITDAGVQILLGKKAFGSIFLRRVGRPIWLTTSLRELSSFAAALAARLGEVPTPPSKLDYPSILTQPSWARREAAELARSRAFVLIQDSEGVLPELMMPGQAPTNPGDRKPSPEPSRLQVIFDALGWGQPAEDPTPPPLPDTRPSASPPEPGTPKRRGRRHG